MKFWDKLLSSFSFNNEEEIAQTNNLVNDTINQLLAEELYPLAMTTDSFHGSTVIPNNSIQVSADGQLIGNNIIVSSFTFAANNAYLTLTASSSDDFLNQSWILPATIPQVGQSLSIDDFDIENSTATLGWQNVILSETSSNLQNSIVIWGATSDKVAASKFFIENDTLFFPSGENLDKTFSIKGNSNQTDNLLTLTFPADKGKNGQLFQTNGEGVLTWVDPPEGLGNVFGSGESNKLTFWVDETSISSTNIEITNTTDSTKLSKINELEAKSVTVNSINSHSINNIDACYSKELHTDNIKLLNLTKDKGITLTIPDTLNLNYEIIFPNIAPTEDSILIFNSNDEFEWAHVNKIVTPDITVPSAIAVWGDTKGAEILNTKILVDASKRGLMLPNNASTFYTTILAPSSIATNYTITLPDTAGENGQVLTNIGGNKTKWAAPSTGILGPYSTVVNAVAVWGNDKGTAFATPSKNVKIDPSTGSLILPAGATGTQNLILKASTQQTTNVVLALPYSVGEEGQVLTSTGTNQLEWKYPVLIDQPTQKNHLVYWGDDDGSTLLSAADMYITEGKNLVVENYIITDKLQLSAGTELKHTLTFQASYSQSKNIVLTFPETTGKVGDVLTTNSNGILSFSAITAGGINGPIASIPNTIAIWDGTDGKTLRNSTIAYDPATATITTPQGGISALYFTLFNPVDPDLSTVDIRSSLAQTESYNLIFPADIPVSKGMVLYASEVIEATHDTNTEIILDWTDLVTSEANPALYSIPVWGTDVASGYLANTLVKVTLDSSGLIFKLGIEEENRTIVFKANSEVIDADSYNLYLPGNAAPEVGMFLTIGKRVPDTEGEEGKVELFLDWTEAPPYPPAYIVP